MNSIENVIEMIMQCVFKILLNFFQAVFLLSIIFVFNIVSAFLFSYSRPTEMSHQCGYFQNYSDLLSLLQCQSATNVTIVVQLHINFFFNVKKKNYRENRVGHGKTEALQKA